ncbi:MAG TPA: CDP-alcohol phosphatidyltransferase family protein [Bacteroidales bacterium]|nr:CDP-alcohol phosphatidyltransferase family protein [Bacteroidales bacterium]HPE58258.1 CDP-alcohol phosphatidyltransferase family protein [Bacteroidales bacterium]HRX95760.1 CDP-alcohol phosphatidyltransferase family protein [Bacteroidales bacterium]
MPVNKNLPNIISSYRLVAFPFLIFFAIQRMEVIFAWLLIINLLSDILDGYIARKFKLTTQLGARLDSIADIGTYIAAFCGVFVFKLDVFSDHLLSFGIFITLFILSNILSFVKFGRLPSLHLYSWKIGGYIQGAFFIWLFAVGFNLPFYFFMISWGILAFTEHIIIQLIIDEMKSNAKGLYWILKDKKH